MASESAIYEIEQHAGHCKLRLWREIVAVSRCSELTCRDLCGNRDLKLVRDWCVQVDILICRSQRE